MNVLFVVNNNKDKDHSISKEIASYLKNKSVNIYCDDSEFAELLELYNFEDSMASTIDFALVLGGDGTVLKYASKYGKYHFPYVGVNMGRVGALTILELDNYKSYLDKIINGEYEVVHQLGLDGEIVYRDGKVINFTSYNDIIFHRGLSLKLLPILIGVNESDKDLFYADGVIVATPVGSSAYNASAGGPLLSYGSKSYVITPICPQSKSFTPLVVSEEDEVSLSMTNKVNVMDNEVIVSVDGCFKYFVSPFDEIKVRKSNSTLKMIRFNKNDSLYTSVYKAVASIDKKGEK
jgi:NAD+ kinase